MEKNPVTRQELTTCAFGLRFLFRAAFGAVGDIVIAVVAGALAQFFFGRHIILDTHAHIDRQNTVDAVLVPLTHFFEKLDHVGFKIQGHFGFRGTRFDVSSDGVPFLRKHVHHLNGDVVFVHAHQIGQQAVFFNSLVIGGAVHGHSFRCHDPSAGRLRTGACNVRAAPT